MGGKHRRAFAGRKSPPTIGKERNHTHRWQTFTKLKGIIFERCIAPKCKAHHRKVVT